MTWHNFVSQSGSLGTGGAGASNYRSGGGGGGYYGGGGGVDGGGGGSSYCLYTITSNLQDVNSGPGSLVIVANAEPHVPYLVTIRYNGMRNSLFSLGSPALHGAKRALSDTLQITPAQLRHMKVLDEPHYTASRLVAVICVRMSEFGSIYPSDIFSLRILQAMTDGTYWSNFVGAALEMGMPNTAGLSSITFGGVMNGSLVTNDHRVRCT